MVAVFAATEALVTGLIGLMVAVVPAVIAWLSLAGSGADLFSFVWASLKVWLLGHGVDFSATVEPQIITSVLGVGATQSSFTISIMILGFALITALSGWRLGRRSLGAGAPTTGAVATVLVYAALGLFLASLSNVLPVSANLVQAALLPPLVVFIGFVCALIHDGWFRELVQNQPVLARLRPYLRFVERVLRLGLGTTFGLLTAGALILTIRLVFDYGHIIGLSQNLDPGPAGGFALLIGEITLLPNLVVWTVAWLLGPGYSLGVDTLVSPAGVAAGSFPGIPILGALPTATGWFVNGLILLPVLLAAIGAYRTLKAKTIWQAGVNAVAVGLVVAVTLALLCWWSSGAVGPGRLHNVGPNWFPVALVAFVTTAIGVLIGSTLHRFRYTGAQTSGAQLNSSMVL